MKKQILYLAVLLLSLPAASAANSASPLSADSITVSGNLMALLAQQVVIGVHNTSATDYEDRLYLHAFRTEDQSSVTCLDTLVTISAGSFTELTLYTPLPEGHLQLRLTTDAAARQVVGTNDVYIRQLRKLDFKAHFTVNMLTATADGEHVLYSNTVSGRVRVENADLPYYGCHGGDASDDGVVCWIEDRDSHERLYMSSVASRLQGGEYQEKPFAYEGSLRDGTHLALKAAYRMPYGLELIDSLCFTVRTGTNTYWTADGHVLPLPPEEAPSAGSATQTLKVPAEAVAVDLRGLRNTGTQYAIDLSQANPNCLYYLDPADYMPQGLDAGSNVIQGLKARNIRLTEGHDYYCPLPFEAELISYLMTPSYDTDDPLMQGRGYSKTIVLPFRPSHVLLYDINGTIEALHSDMIELLRYDGTHADTLTLSRAAVETMEPYAPYILGVYVGSRLLFMGQNAEVPKTREAIVRDERLNFVGTTVTRRLTNRCHVYNAADNSFQRSDDNATAAPFQAFLDDVANDVSTLLRISDSVWGAKGNPNNATAITETKADSGNRWDGAAYDLLGRRAPLHPAGTQQHNDTQQPSGTLQPAASRRLPKGIYIVGGRKVVVK